MRVDRLVLENYRGFGTLDLELPEGPVCLLVGRNGSGKSSVVDALSWVLGDPAPWFNPPTASGAC